MDFNENDFIGNYRLLKLCGTGSYGKVFLAKNQLTGHDVALKIITDNGKIMERELRGLINYRNCRHENLLQIHHIDKIDGMLYYTMDAADNINNSIENYQPNTLGYKLDRIDRMYPAAVKKMGSELLAGIQKLHSFGIIHRDIKPDNILWINGKAVLGDIGLIAGNRNSTLAGTPEFMSPDLLARKRSANESDDLFSLSRVLYCAFTGYTPDRFPQLPPGLLKETGAIDTWKFILSIYRNVPPVKSDTNSSTDYTDRKRKKLQIILLIITILSFLLALPTAFISLIFSPAVSPFVLDAILLIFIVTLFWNISLIRSTALKILLYFFSITMLAGSVFLAFIWHYSIYLHPFKSPKLPGSDKTVLSITTETLEKKEWSRDGKKATLKARVKSGPHKGKSVTIDFSADENGELIWDHPVTDKQLGNTTEEVLRTLIQE